ncbi:two-component regulator propeller domain-containing protein [Roseivirga sp. E12]|uniref:ligand-binding sensor domain-containing protein n=1 Tax=Roseivirga sp. E12 TaxID=2819237 RepID=UPI001ABC172C|nr:sensor histidine kinase [Roseivirga sp. E12]MBO3699290.1 hypothetical protein [Roseivirga sp. E12]
MTLISLLLIHLFQLNTDPLPPVQVINTSDGLSNSIVYDIHKDAEGFIWMATDNGLNRYDGYTFKEFYHSEIDPHSISSNTVRSIEEGPDGDLWVGTFDGLNRFNKKTEQFERFHALPNGIVNRLDLQKMVLVANDRIWFSNLEVAGWFDLNTLTFEFFQLDQLPHDMAVDDEGRLWLQTQDGNLWRFDDNSQSLVKIDHNPRKKPSQIHFGRHSKLLWLSERVDGKTYSTEALPAISGEFETFVVYEIDSINVWLGTDQGLYSYNRMKKYLKKINLGNATSVLSESIKSIYQDDTGTIWVGTLSGAFLFNPYQKPFHHLDLLKEQSDVVMGMVEFKETILINTLGQGLYQYDPITQDLTSISFNGTPPVGHDYIWNITVVPDTDFPIWLATNAGLILFNPTSGGWKHVKLPGKDQNISPVFAIQRQTNEYLWVTDANQIYTLAKTGEYHNTVAGLPVIRSVIQDLVQLDNELYLATDSGILSVVDLLTQSSKPLSAYNKKADVLLNTPIWDLHLTGQTLWIGTNQGLYKYNTLSFDFEKIKLNENDENNIIFSIAPSVDNELWMGTEAGIFRFNLTSEEVTHYVHKDGLVNYEFNRKSVVIDANEHLWFGGVNGITYFDPKQIKENPVSPPVYITAVNVISKDTSFVQRISDQKEMILPWYQNTIEFDFVALNYSNSEQNQYQYQLAGYDHNWVTPNNNRQVRYLQLPPGSYEFMVKGANNDGLWNPTASTLKIRILPPFWRTFWFQALMFLIVAISLYMIYRYRVHRLLEIERLKLRIAGDLHDEVGSGLSSIALNGDLLQLQLEAGQPKSELVSRITGNARNLASSLDDIVWLIDPQKETLGDFINRVRSMARELLTSTAFTLEEKVGNDSRGVTLHAEVKRNLFLLTKEIFHNIAKHAGASSVSLRLTYAEGRLHMSVLDDGKGFNTDQESDGHGLVSMQKRAQELSGRLIIDSVEGKGTQISFDMKLP